MPDETANLALPYLLASQAQKHVTLNESLTRLDALVQLAVESRVVGAQPVSPAEGVRYVLPSGASGADWAGQPGKIIAHYRDGIWDFIAPRAGFLAFVRDEAAMIWFDGTDWRLVEGALDELQSVALFGLGATADPATPYLVKLGKAVFTAKLAAEGGDGDLRVILNKEAAGDVASLLLQHAFSGRAEVGLIGDDDLTIKVSSDGAAWMEALRIARASGQIRAPFGASVASLNAGPLAGFRNRLINGDFAINERAFTGGALASGAYGHDRWKARSAGLSYAVSGGVVTLTAGTLGQILESPGLAGATVTVSVEDLTTRDLNVTLSAFGSGSGAVSGQIAAGAGRKGVTLAIPATATGHIAVDLAPAAAGAGAPSFKKAQLETGAEATPFEIRPPSLEQIMCMRYFERLGANGDSGALTFAPAVRLGTPYVDAAIAYRVAKRAAASLYSSSPSFAAALPTTGNDYALYNYAATAVLTAVGAVTLSLLNSRLTSTVLRFQAATSLSGSAGNACALYVGSGALIGFEAEL